MPSPSVTAAPAQPAFTPEQIGQRAKQAAASRNTQGLGTEARLHQFETLRSLLQHIRNLPSDARPDLRVKGNDLVAKLGAGQHRILIGGFRLASDNDGKINALQALNVSRQTHESCSERFLCALSWIGNRLRGHTADRARSEHLALDRSTLENLVDHRLNVLMTDRSGHNGITPHGDLEFFRGKDAASLDLERRNLVAMPLHECDLRHADLHGKDLSGCSLPKNLTGVDLRGATLFGVSFGEQSPFHRQLSTDHGSMYALDRRPRTYKAFATKEGLTYPDFTGVILKDAKLSMAYAAADLPRADSNQRASELDLRFNHINNTSTGSILKTIHSIEDHALKRALMEECLERLISGCSPSDRAQIAQPLTDILFHRAYLEPGSGQTIAANTRTIIDELVAANFDTGNSRLLDLTPFPNLDKNLFLGVHIDHALKLVNDASAISPRGLDDSLAAYIQQLIQACSRIDDTDLRDRALTLQQVLLKLPEYARSVQSMSEILGYDEQDPPELGGMAVFDCGNGRTTVMTGDYYQTFIQGAGTADEAARNAECGVALYARHESIDTANLRDHIRGNRFLQGFLSPVLARNDKSSHLRRLQLDEYMEKFVEAATKNAYRGDPLTSDAHKSRLEQIVRPFLLDQSLAGKRQVTVVGSYIRDVLADNEMTQHSGHEQGYLLFCLSAIFTRYSSSAQFGTAEDSPDALRAFAAGLLTHARERLGVGNPPDRIIEGFQDRLLGNTKGTVNCTAQAFGDMNAMLRTMTSDSRALTAIYDKTMPPTWR